MMSLFTTDSFSFVHLFLALVLGLIVGSVGILVIRAFLSRKEHSALKESFNNKLFLISKQIQKNNIQEVAQILPYINNLFREFVDPNMTEKMQGEVREIFRGKLETLNRAILLACTTIEKFEPGKALSFVERTNNLQMSCMRAIEEEMRVREALQALVALMIILNKVNLCLIHINDRLIKEITEESRA